MRAELKEKLAVLFNADDVTAIEAFLDYGGGFSLAGQMALVDTFLEMQEYMMVSRMIEQCQKEWTRNWAHQPPSIRGSPAAEGRYGIENIVAIENFYYANGLPSSPLVGVPVEIPAEEFTVLTRHSTYWFGVVDLNGTREVQRAPDKLPFERCVLLRTATLGKAMPIGRCDRGDDAIDKAWWTMPITDLR